MRKVWSLCQNGDSAGSGKTHTLLALLEMLCLAGRQETFAPRPILFCAETNAAVDNLVYGLLRRRIRVVRIGPPAKARHTLMLATLEARAEKTEAGLQARLARQEVANLKRYLASEVRNPPPLSIRDRLSRALCRIIFERRH